MRRWLSHRTQNVLGRILERFVNAVYPIGEEEELLWREESPPKNKPTIR